MRPYLFAPILMLLLAGCSQPVLTIKSLIGPATVLDGDTIQIGKRQLQLYGIKSPNADEQGFAEARDALKAVVGNETVFCFIRDPKSEAGAFCELKSPTGTNDIVEPLLAQGLAKVDRRFAGVWARRLTGYETLEAEARANCKGLWETLPECREAATRPSGS